VEEKVPKYVELNTSLNLLAHKLTAYYTAAILPDLFSYELIK
jgi:hypothetical protein